VSAHLEHSLDVPLTFGERTRIVVQLGTAMLAGALLAVGWLQMQYGSEDLRNVAELIIALAALIVAAPIFYSAVRGLFVSDAHTMTEQLVALAVLAAMMTGNFITATLIPVILNIGHFLEERSVLGAQAAIEGLRTLHARSATLLTDSGEQEVDPESLKPGDLILARPGDTIAADGEILEGQSAIDQSSITGESAPEDAGPGTSVFAGTINLSGLLRIRVTKTGSQTALGQVVDLLRDAERSKTPAMQLIEQYAGYYVPIILIIAAVVLFITRDMSRAVSVLVVGCPQAFVLAGPTAMVAALATASRLGILIKNTRFLESLADVDTVVLDKTGTVTLGKLELVTVRPLGGIDNDDVLKAAARCSAASKHPVSRAITETARQRGLIPEDRPLQGTVEEIAGKGVRAETDAGPILLGRREWLLELGADVPESPNHAGPVVWVGRYDGPAEAGSPRPLGCLLLADVPRPEAKQAIVDLRRLGLDRAVLLTGDRREVAEHVAESLQTDEVIAEVLPQQKLDAIRRESQQGRSVMMVGDGVNDALALASGDVGVALGAVASDVALKSADVALMTNDLGRLPTTIELARRTRRTIHQNIIVGGVISIGFVALASIGLIEPLVAAILHNVGELFVIGNSARLLGAAEQEN
jgi:heavy metal translocating P-type ATPase